MDCAPEASGSRPQAFYPGHLHRPDGSRPAVLGKRLLPACWMSLLRRLAAGTNQTQATPTLASMKHYLLACSLLLATAAQAQKRAAAVATAPVVFCNLLVEGQHLDRVEMKLDYGQTSKAQAQEADLAEADGQIQQLNSVAAALNYMASRGWDFVAVTAMTRSGGGPMANNTLLGYLLRRRP